MHLPTMPPNRSAALWLRGDLVAGILFGIKGKWDICPTFIGREDPCLMGWAQPYPNLVQMSTVGRALPGLCLTCRPRTCCKLTAASRGAKGSSGPGPGPASLSQRLPPSLTASLRPATAWTPLYCVTCGRDLRSLADRCHE